MSFSFGDCSIDGVLLRKYHVPNTERMQSHDVASFLQRKNGEDIHKSLKLSHKRYLKNVDYVAVLLCYLTLAFHF